MPSQDEQTSLQRAQCARAQAPPVRSVTGYKHRSMDTWENRSTLCGGM